MVEHIRSKKEAAQFFGVSVQALDGWFTAGCPVQERDEHGRIKTVCLKAMVQWRIARADKEGRDLERERTRLTKAQADKTELEVAELRSELVRMPIVEQHWQSLVAAMRSKLLALPSKIAAQIADPGRLHSTQEKATALVYEALSEIANDGMPHEIRVRSERNGNRASQVDATRGDSR